jgi:hypothetical protein
MPIQQYDYIIYSQDPLSNIYFVKNGDTGTTELNTTDAAPSHKLRLQKENSVYKNSYYQLHSDVICHNKKGAIITGKAQPVLQ